MFARTVQPSFCTTRVQTLTKPQPDWLNEWTLTYIPINIAGITDHDPIKNVFIDQIWIKCMDKILIN